MSDMTLDKVYVKICNVEAKVDKLDDTVTEHRVSVEHRLTKVEVRSSLLGTVSGAIAGAT